MTAHVKVSGAWKNVASVHTKVSGAWKTAADMPVKVAGVWKTGILASGSFESIATATGTGSSGTITFSSIPSTYVALQIRGNFTEGSGNTIKIKFNSDSTSSYAFHDLNGYGSGVYASGAATQGQAYLNYYGTSSTANTMTTALMDVQDYASTSKNKTFRVLTGYDQNGSGCVSLVSGLWYKTDAITSISIIAPNPWTTSTTFALYGIKGA